MIPTKAPIPQKGQGAVPQQPAGQRPVPACGATPEEKQSLHKTAHRKHNLWAIIVGVQVVVLAVLIVLLVNKDRKVEEYEEETSAPMEEYETEEVAVEDCVVEEAVDWDEVATDVAVEEVTPAYDYNDYYYE